MESLDQLGGRGGFDVIPRAYIDAWRAQAPWRSDAKVEQDLIICRAMVEIFNNFEAGFTVVEREIVPRL